MPKQFPHFTNREYEYYTPDDTILIRGLQINELIDHVNDNVAGDTRVEDIEAGDSLSIDVGSTETDRAIFIRFALDNGTKYQMGTINIINRNGTPALFKQGIFDSFDTDFAVSASSGDIILTITADAGEGTITFTYNKSNIEIQNVTT